MKNEITKEPPLSQKSKQGSNAELKGLMIKSIQWSEAVYNQNKKIQNHLRWMSIMGFLRLFIILIPIIIGIIYLPPLLSGVWSQYQSLLGIGSGGIPVDSDSLRTLIDQFGDGASSIDIQEVLGKFSGQQ
jgi:hypothetical protein